MESRKITIVGAGNLGVAIAKGITKANLFRNRDITLTRRDTKPLDELVNQGYNATANNQQAITEADLIFLCVQPNQLVNVISELNPVLKSNQVIVSVITGVSISQIRELIDLPITIIRAMPNTAIAIGESITCLATDEDSVLNMSEVEQLFGALGKTLVIDEELMQAATVLGASGIAFFMRYLRAATQGGVQMGFHSEDAQLIAVQTAKGAASLILEKETHPEIEIDKVTTPQGCTIEGLNEMEHKGFSSALIQGLMTSFHRISKMKSGQKKIKSYEPV